MDQQKFSSHIGFIKTPDDVDIRYGYFPSDLNCRGLIVLLNGRSEFMEKYEEPIGLLNQRGFDVFSFDWRGQGLSSRFLENRHKGFVHRFEDYLMDLKTGLQQIVFPRQKKPVILLAHSMGGHMALRFLHDQCRSTDGLEWKDHLPEIDGAVLSSPMFDINTWPIPGKGAQMLAGMMFAAGFGGAYAPGCGDYVPSRQEFKRNRLTSDPVRFQDHVRSVVKNPDLALGGPTYAWLYAAYNSAGLLHQPGYAAAIDCPVLIALGENEKIVSPEAIRSICSRLPDGNLVLIKNARHEILKETDEIQKSFWCAFDQFTKRIGTCASCNETPSSRKISDHPKERYL